MGWLEFTAVVFYAAITLGVPAWCAWEDARWRRDLERRRLDLRMWDEIQASFIGEPADVREVAPTELGVAPCMALDRADSHVIIPEDAPPTLVLSEVTTIDGDSRRETPQPTTAEEEEAEESVLCA